MPTLDEETGVFPTYLLSSTAQTVTASCNAFSTVHFSKLAWCRLLRAALPGEHLSPCILSLGTQLTGQGHVGDLSLCRT